MECQYQGYSVFRRPHAIIKAFKRGYELEETYWMYWSLYLSSAKQSQGESAAALATRVEDLVNQCQWPDAQKETRRIDLFYHLTDFFYVKCYVQNETARDSGNLTWEKLVEEAKHQERVGKEYARFRRWHTILQRSSLSSRHCVKGVQEASEIRETTRWQTTRQEPGTV